MSIGNLTSIGNKVETGNTKLYLISVSVNGQYNANVQCNFYSAQEIKTYEDLVNFFTSKNFTNRMMPCFGRGTSGYTAEGIRFSGGKIEASYYNDFDTTHILSQSDKSKIHITCNEV